MYELFGGRRTKRELLDLKEEHQHLEERFDSLREEHEKLQHETGEQTNMRISYIEEEIESMNQRVEKLASDSYEIRGEVRDIHESVLGMQTSLSEIVKLYKAIIEQYGFGEMKKAAARQRTHAPRPDDEPGDAIIRALEKERDPTPKAPARGTGPRKAGPRSREGGPAASPPPRPRPPPMSGNALDELHRLSRVERNGEELTAKVVARSDRGDKVDKVARRDLERPEPGQLDREGDFTRSLPRKELRPKEGRAPVGKAPAGRARAGTAGDGDWESMEPPAASGGKRRPRPKLEDLLDPE